MLTVTGGLLVELLTAVVIRSRDPVSVGAGGGGEEHGELVATGPGREFCDPDRSQDGARDNHERLVAGFMPVGVIDRFELVDVDHQKRAVQQLVLGDRRDPVLERSAIG